MGRQGWGQPDEAAQHGVGLVQAAQALQGLREIAERLVRRRRLGHGLPVGFDGLCMPVLPQPQPAQVGQHGRAALAGQARGQRRAQHGLAPFGLQHRQIASSFGVAWVQRQHALPGLAGAHGVAGLVQPLAEREPGVGTIRCQRQRLAQACRGGGGVASSSQRRGGMHAQARIARPRDDGALEGQCRVVMPPQREQCPRAIAQRCRQARLQGQRRVEGRQRLGRLLQRKQRIAQVVVRTRQPRLQAQGLLVGSTRLRPAAARGQQRAEVGGQIGVGRQQLHRALQRRQRVLAQHLLGHGQGLPQLAIVGLLREQLARLGGHLRVAARLEKREKVLKWDVCHGIGGA